MSSLSPRLLAKVPRLDAGKPCGRGYIASGLTCRATPAQPAKPVNWRRRAAIGAGITAGALAVGLPAASFAVSGSPQGRRTSQAVEGLARSTAAGLQGWSNIRAAHVVTEPLRMGVMAGAEGIRTARWGRSTVESWRYAPGFAREAVHLAGRKSESAAARRHYIAQLQAAWAAQRKAPTQRLLAHRRREIGREQAKAERYSRQAATRLRAARRAGRIARGGAPFRESPTPMESFIRRGLANPSPGPRGRLERSGAALTAGLLRQLQSTGRGLGRRRVRFYG